VTLARVTRAAAVPAFDGLVGEHERDGAAWKAEWSFLPQACTAAGAALALGGRLLDGLQVDAERMRANVEGAGDWILAEPALAVLGERIGRQRARAAVQAAAERGAGTGRTLRDTLLEDPAVAEHISAAELDAALRPERALGAIDALIDRALAG
jgi:adenylosuccinate lyase